MSRHHLSEDRVRLVISNLVDLYCKLGSVSKVTKVLEELVGDEAKTLHINRIQTLLSGEVTRSVNTDTLESIELGLSRLPRNTDKGEEDVIRARILNAESLLAPISGFTDKENLSQVAKKAEVPYLMKEIKFQKILLLY